MKFNYGDEVIIKDDFALYKGVLVSRLYRRSWRTLWMKSAWYEVMIYEVNGKRAAGNILVPENMLILDGPEQVSKGATIRLLSDKTKDDE